jgi:hypothetical protein
MSGEESENIDGVSVTPPKSAGKKPERTIQAVMLDDDSDDDPFDRLEKLILRFSSANKRSRVTQNSPLGSDESESLRASKRIRKPSSLPVPPPVVRFGPIPSNSSLNNGPPNTIAVAFLISL